jgi:LuxR family transcriptional regulator
VDLREKEALQYKYGRSWEFHRVNIHLSKLNELRDLALEQVGFEFFSFLYKEPLPASSPPVYTFNNFPEKLNQIYDENKYWDIDPILNHMGRRDFTVWSVNIDRDEPISKLLECHKEIKDGVTFYFPMRDGSMASISFAGSEPITKEFSQSISLGAYIVYKAALKVIKRERGGGCKALSEPEMRVLRLTADGMTAEQIASKIFVTKNTVNFHIKNIIIKLRCKNKTQAIAKAALMNIL